MQPHPIPQNVTTFQFHLIGDMTLKQFLYLAAGCGIAYLLFVSVTHSYPLIAWPAIVISAGSGVALAFLPINSRPLDYWIAAFLKAVYSPTKRVWQKNGKVYKSDPLFNSRYITYLSSLQPRPTSQNIDASTAQQIETSTPALTPQIPTVQPAETAKPDLPTTDELKKTVELARQAQELQVKIVQTERQLSQIKTEAQKPNQNPIDYSQQVNKILSELQNLINQGSQIKQQIEAVSAEQNIVAKVVQPPPPAVKPQVKVVVMEKPKQAQVALTTFPNVINGIIKDSQGNYLEAVVVVIYDKEGLPVRALKTNKLGQFTGSTPLANGTYTVELEKDDLVFDVLQVELTGQVLSPLVITPKIGSSN